VFPLAESAFDAFVEISVRDTGIGISREGLDKLFQPFSQIDGGLSRKFEGTGLGLAMVKLLVELHGGAVGVESTVGQGSCFSAWLPLRAVDEQPVPPPRTVPVARLLPLEKRNGPPTALVVEDDPRAAELIRLQLEATGFRVLHALSAEDAMQLAMEQPVSLITLDIMLPGMDGWSFLRRLKAAPALAQIPVVIISIEADASRGEALEAAAVLQKPISRQELTDSLLALQLVPTNDRSARVTFAVHDEPTAQRLEACAMPFEEPSSSRATGRP
jgi:CheY-like chemotaxis protein